MEVKVLSHKIAKSGVYVRIGFVKPAKKNGAPDKVLQSSIYRLEEGQTVDDILPKVKRDLANYEKFVQQSKGIDGKALDLSEVEAEKDEKEETEE